MIQKRDKHRLSLCKEKSNVITSISISPEASTETGSQTLTLVCQYIDYNLLIFKPREQPVFAFPLFGNVCFRGRNSRYAA
jgi:hypothetical protein